MRLGLDHAVHIIATACYQSRILLATIPMATRASLDDLLRMVLLCDKFPTWDSDLELKKLASCRAQAMNPVERVSSQFS